MPWKRSPGRSLRRRSRVTGAFAQPLVFWLLLGGGLKASFRPPGLPDGTSYVEYFYPGTIVLVLLFTAIFSTISVIEDRREGFLQGVLVAPIPRSAIVFGNLLGGTCLATFQGLLFLGAVPFLGISLSIGNFFFVCVVIILMSFGLTGLGFV